MNSVGGAVLKKFFDQAIVPLQWREVIATRVAIDFRFKGARERRPRLYVDYMAGVFGINRTLREDTPVIEEAETVPDTENERDEEDVDSDFDGASTTTQRLQSQSYHTSAVAGADEDQELLDQQLTATLTQFGQSFSPSAEDRPRSPLRPILTSFSQDLLAAAAQRTALGMSTFTYDRADHSDAVDLTAETSIATAGPDAFSSASQPQSPSVPAPACRPEEDHLRLLARSVSVLSIQPDTENYTHEDDDVELEMIIEEKSTVPDEEDNEVEEVEVIVID